ncbi:hypothetical protein GCM10011579_058330 [Streptomyces albiflavescens]|uniref:Uncharacterized protein n=1 Tax=Streptomyces albiflavescens TaxID=1623582 RepID=A0A918D7D6_9ACTN|nr:hypothetical protein [Streptomyces albiflavescens]GGN76798.1 hypothetical protein GCM10011579_058330 [Streptomyces albiflavescens]
MQHRRPHLSKKAKTLLASSVALAAAAGITVAQAGEDGKKCGAFDTVTMGKYYVNNNLWGQGDGTFTQSLVRRKLMSKDKYLSGIESGSEVFRGSGRLDTRSYSVDIG